MNPLDIIVVIALILAIIIQFDAKGRDLIAWSVILICVRLLWGALQ